MSEENQNEDVNDSADEQEPDGIGQDESPEDDAGDDQGDDFDRDRALAKVKKLNSENRNLRQAKKDAEEKARNAEGKTEQMQALEAKNARYETLAENDLPLRLAKFISATDPEEILEQAEELLSLGGGSNTPPSDQPREKNRRMGKPHNTDELANPDDFIQNIYSN